MQKINDFTEGKILSPLLKFAGPVLLALLLQSLYGAVDVLIVGRFAATVDVSGVSTGSQLMSSVTLILSGLAMGMTIMLGQFIGEKRSEESGDIIGTGILLFAVIAVVLSVLFCLLASPLASLLRAPEEAFTETVSYIRICSAGLIFIVAYNALGSVFRGIGDSLMPLIAVAIACVTNIFGDLALVAGLRMGAAGAALATVGAQAISVLLSLLIIRRRKLPFTFTGHSIRWKGEYVRQIVRLGLPLGSQDLLITFSFLAITAIINTLGLYQSAGMGVAQKVTGFVMLVPSAAMQALAAFVAQNYGARKMARARRAVYYGIGISLLAGIVMWYLVFFHGSFLSSIFSTDAQVIAMSADYLRAYGLDCLIGSMTFCFVGFFNGMGKTTFTMVQGISTAFLVRLPIAYLMSRIPGVSLFYVGLAIPASTTAQFLICLVYFVILIAKEKKEQKLQIHA